MPFAEAYEKGLRPVRPHEIRIPNQSEPGAATGKQLKQRTDNYPMTLRRFTGLGNMSGAEKAGDTDMADCQRNPNRAYKVPADSRGNHLSLLQLPTGRPAANQAVYKY